MPSPSDTKFLIAVEALLSQEGGLSDDPDDSGQVTNFGVSLRWLKTVQPDATADTIRTLTREQAIQLYKTHWWAYSLIDSQAVANKLLDMAVNLGSKTAHKLLQASLNRLGRNLVEDGLLGMLTLKAVNSVPAGELLRELRAAQALRYVRIVLANPTQERFINGWIRRAVA